MTPAETVAWLVEFRTRLEADTSFMRYVDEQVANANIRGRRRITRDDFITRYVDDYREAMRQDAATQ